MMMTTTGPSGVPEGEDDTAKATLDTWCPLCGDVTAELHAGEFQCPECGLTIPRRVVELGREVSGDV